MSLTELRESLAAVSDAVQVTPPDAVAFQARVRRARRRRSTGVAAGVVAAAVVVAGATTLALDRGPETAAPVAQRPPDEAARPARQLPVLLGGRLRTVAADGTLSGPGPEVRSIAGTTARGVVAVTDGGMVVEVGRSGSVTNLLDVPVRVAYVAGEDLVYDTGDETVRWRRVTPGIDPSDHETLSGEHLLGAGPGGVVVTGPDGVQVQDAAGAHPLEVEPDTRSLLQADAAGGVVALRTDRGDLLYTDHGRRRVALPGDRYAALAPDGSAYARATASRLAVELVDPATGRATPVGGVSGRVTGLAWTDADQLYVVTGSSTLWSCPVGSTCTRLLSEITGGLALR
jgi:hypothetical protein